MKVITTDNASATQTEHPWRSSLRTVLQAALLVYPVFLALPEILKVIDEDLGAFIPDEARAQLLLIATVVAAGAGALARIMAIPAVEKILRKIGAGAAPSELAFDDWTGGDVDEVIPVTEPDTEDYDGDDAEPEGFADDEELESSTRTEDDEDAEPEGPADEEDLETIAATEVDDTPPPEDYRPKH